MQPMQLYRNKANAFGYCKVPTGQRERRVKWFSALRSFKIEE